MLILLQDCDRKPRQGRHSSSLMDLTEKYVWRTLHRKVKESWNQMGSRDQTLMNERRLSRWRVGAGVVVTGAEEPKSGSTDCSLETMQPAKRA